MPGKTKVEALSVKKLTTQSLYLCDLCGCPIEIMESH